MSSGSEGFSARLLLVLSSLGQLSPEDADLALSEAKKRSCWVEEVLEERGLVDRQQMAEALAHSYHLPVCRQDLKSICEELKKVIPPDFCRDHQLIAVSQENKTLLVASSSPPNTRVLKELQVLTGHQTAVVVIDRLTLRDSLGTLPPIFPPSRRSAAQAEPVQAPPPRKAESESPAVLGGRYQLGEQLMACRFSTLFRANDPISGHPQILRKLEGSYKYLATEQQQDPQQREARLQILREGRTLSRLRHRNLPRVRDIFEERKDIYLVLDEIPGQTLVLCQT